MLVFLMSAGCGSKDVILNGQIFIVTNSGDNKKLGLVEVCLIEQGPTQEFVTKKNAEIGKEVARAKAELTLVKRKVKEAQAALDAYVATNATIQDAFLSLEEENMALKKEIKATEEAMIYYHEWTANWTERLRIIGEETLTGSYKDYSDEGQLKREYNPFAESDVQMKKGNGLETEGALKQAELNTHTTEFAEYKSKVT